MSTLSIIGLSLPGLIVFGLAYIGFLYLTRGTPLSYVQSFSGRDGAPPVSDPEFCRLIGLHTRTALERGHAIEVLFNGDGTYERLWADLRGATKSITLQMYYCKKGRVADTFREIAIERARAGVNVLVLMDALGAGNLGKEYHEALRAAGVQVAEFRPVKWYELHKFQHRSHIRVVTVDGRIGYTGGFGFDDKWLGNGLREGEWRDTNVRFEGPAVAQLQATFASAWCEVEGVLLNGDVYFPPETHAGAGGAVAGLAHAAPTVGSTVAERCLALAIAGAEKTLYIANAYFVPDDDFRKLLCDAVKRGVDVRVLMPGDKIDVKSTRWAAHATMAELLGGGVRVYEYAPSMMHAKTFVVDSLWTTIGTINFDNRSLAFNDETQLLIHDERVGALMHQRFLDDLGHAEELDLATFRKRPLKDKAMEQVVRMFARLL